MPDPVVDPFELGMPEWVLEPAPPPPRPVGNVGRNRLARAVAGGGGGGIAAFQFDPAPAVVNPEIDAQIAAQVAVVNDARNARDRAMQVMEQQRGLLLRELDRGRQDASRVAYDDATAEYRTANSALQSQQAFLRTLREEASRRPSPNAKAKKYKKCVERGSATPNFFIHYDTAEEYRLRLRGTFISYDGSPVFVNDIINAGIVEAKSLMVFDADGDTVEIDLRDEEERAKLSSRTIQPGYYNIPFGEHPHAGYLYRRPVRVYRQGLCSDNSQFDVPHYGNYTIGQFNHIELVKILASRTIQPLTRDLMALVKARETHRQMGFASSALSLNFAVARKTGIEGTQLMFRGQKLCDVADDLRPSIDLRETIPATLHDELTAINL